MERNALAFPTLVLAGLGFGVTLAGAAITHNTAESEAVIDAEAHCFNSGGLSIDFEGRDSAKVACMENKKVQRVCGQDGGLTRQQAFTQWYRKLEQFQAHCASGGGTFAFQDSSFKEPTDETYCLQAQPEIGSNMFEESLCNYRSVCPAVTVMCTYGVGTVAHLPGGPNDFRSE